MPTPAAKPSPRTARPSPTVRRSPMEHPRHQYPEETAALQELIRSCGLTETIKWGKPCFMLPETGKDKNHKDKDRNIVLIQRFNDYIALLFFQGALLSDPDQRLSRVGKHMQAPRQLRFRSLAEITRLNPVIQAFIRQAIEIERSGARITPRPVAQLEVPPELQARLDAEPALRKAFAALTPGRQKGYIYQVAAAKQSATRTARVEKCIPRILAGKGLND